MDAAAGGGGAGRAAAPLGVVEATRLGWRLLRTDFWRLWAVGLVMLAVMMAAGMVGWPAAIVVQPPLMAGLVYVLLRRAEGGRAEMGDLFAGFKERFGPSVIGWLPVWAASLVFGVLLVLAMLLLFLPGAGLVAAAEGDEVVTGVVVVGGLAVFLLIEAALVVGLTVFGMFFWFVPAAVWDHPESGWQAAASSMRLVRDHFLAMVGFVVLFWLIGAAANLIGLCVCCVGVFFTTPLVLVWEFGALLYLYRSWTGRPLAAPQPAPAGN